VIPRTPKVVTTAIIAIVTIICRIVNPFLRVVTVLFVRFIFAVYLRRGTSLELDELPPWSNISAIVIPTAKLSKMGQFSKVVFGWSQLET
jgi:hypothetical protein